MKRRTPAERLRAATTASEVFDAELVDSWPADLTSAIALRSSRAANAGHLVAAAGIAAQVAATYYGDLEAQNAALRDALTEMVHHCQPPALLAENIKREPTDYLLRQARAALSKATP